MSIFGQAKSSQGEALKVLPSLEMVMDDDLDSGSDDVGLENPATLQWISGGSAQGCSWKISRKLGK